MFEVPKYDPTRLAEIGKGNVAVGERVMTIKEWVNELKELWGFAVKDEEEETVKI